MTVFGRLGILFVVFGGAALLLVDGLRSPPGLWYTATGIIAGTMIVMYTVILSPSPQRPQPAPEPTSPSTSDESTTASPTRQADSSPADTEQTVKSTESAKQEPEPAGDNDPDPPKPSTSKEPEPPISKQLEPPSTSVNKQQSLPADTVTTQRTASHTDSPRTRKTTSTSTHRQRHVTSTASPRRNLSTGTDNPYFKPVDSSREIKFIQVDTRFSYLDVDWEPEFIGLDPVPDLVEVDVGPSAVSHELVRSPIEIKISSFIKSLFTPSPEDAGADAWDETTQSVDASDGRARHRRDDTRARRRQVTRDNQETWYREQDRHVDRPRDPLTAADRRQQPVETWPGSFGRKPVDSRRDTADTAGYGDREDMGVFVGGRSGNRRLLGWEPGMDEEPIGLQDTSRADEPAADVGMDYSPPQWESPQWDADPFGLADVDSGFSEPEEPVFEPVAQSDLGFGMSDWEPEVPIEKPVIDPDVGAEMLGLDGFAEPADEAAGLSGLDAETGSNPLFPDGESFFPEEDLEDDWLTF